MYRAQVRGIHLCTINAPKQADGFYSRVVSVENAASATPASTPAPGTSAGGGAGSAAGTVAGSADATDVFVAPPVIELLRSTSDLARGGLVSVEEKDRLKSEIVAVYHDLDATKGAAGISKAVASRLHALVSRIREVEKLKHVSAGDRIAMEVRRQLPLMP